MDETAFNGFEKTFETSRKTMKQDETSLRNGVMILNFIYSGISLILFVVFLISFLTEGRVFFLGRFIGHVGVSTLIKSLSGIMAIITGVGAVSTFLAGYVIFKYSQSNLVSITEEKKEEEKKKEVSSDVLLPEEKKLIKILSKNEKVMTQKDLVRESEMSKVKVHRLLKKLEAKKVISKYEFGMTKRIRLEKELKD